MMGGKENRPKTTETTAQQNSPSLKDVPFFSASIIDEKAQKHSTVDRSQGGAKKGCAIVF
jgi:hypothetical protein